MRLSQIVAIIAVLLLVASLVVGVFFGLGWPLFVVLYAYGVVTGFGCAVSLHEQGLLKIL